MGHGGVRGESEESPRCRRESRPLSCAANEAKKRGGEAAGG